MSEGSGTGFDLMRMEQLPAPCGDPALVGLFFAGSRSLRSGQLRIDDRSVPRKSFTFNMCARPISLCEKRMATFAQSAISSCWQADFKIAQA